MYQIHKKDNTISAIQKSSFGNLQYKEREHLQERIANNPQALWEELLIIQKEFDGFNETKERLDLLALDTQGNLVIIENKLDDTGRDVVWQSLKYASYCSTLKKSDIITIYQSYLDKCNKWHIAQSELEEFFEWQAWDEIEINSTQSQRVMLVAGNFRKEVTSTVLWLMNYGLRIQCFKATVYVQWDNHLLMVDQIIPIQDAEEYTIKMAEKQQEQIHIQTSQTTKHTLYKEFWGKLLPICNILTPLFANRSTSQDSRLYAGSGISWVSYAFVITKSYCATELYLWHKVAEENLKIFDYLYLYKDAIEKAFGTCLIRDKLEGKKATRISYRLEGVNITRKEDRDQMIEFLTTHMVKLYAACDHYIKKIK